MGVKDSTEAGTSTASKHPEAPAALPPRTAARVGIDTATDISPDSPRGAQNERRQVTQASEPGRASLAPGPVRELRHSVLVRVTEDLHPRVVMGAGPDADPDADPRDRYEVLRSIAPLHVPALRSGRLVGPDWPNDRYQRAAAVWATCTIFARLASSTPVFWPSTQSISDPRTAHTTAPVVPESAHGRVSANGDVLDRGESRPNVRQVVGSDADETMPPDPPEIAYPQPVAPLETPVVVCVPPMMAAISAFETRRQPPVPGVPAGCPTPGTVGAAVPVPDVTPGRQNVAPLVR